MNSKKNISIENREWRCFIDILKQSNSFMQAKDKLDDKFADQVKKRHIFGQLSYIFPIYCTFILLNLSLKDEKLQSEIGLALGVYSFINFQKSPVMFSKFLLLFLGVSLINASSSLDWVDPFLIHSYVIGNHLFESNHYFCLDNNDMHQCYTYICERALAYRANDGQHDFFEVPTKQEFLGFRNMMFAHFNLR